MFTKTATLTIGVAGFRKFCQPLFDVAAEEIGRERGCTIKILWLPSPGAETDARVVNATADVPPENGDEKVYLNGDAADLNVIREVLERLVDRLS